MLERKTPATGDITVNPWKKSNAREKGRLIRKLQLPLHVTFLPMDSIKLDLTGWLTQPITSTLTGL